MYENNSALLRSVLTPDTRWRCCLQNKALSCAAAAEWLVSGLQPQCQALPAFLHNDSVVTSAGTTCCLSRAQHIVPNPDAQPVVLIIAFIILKQWLTLQTINIYIQNQKCDFCFGTNTLYVCMKHN